MKHILILAMMALVIISCSDDSDSPTHPTGNKSTSFFPTSEGSYWIYDIEVNGIPGTSGQDSTFVFGSVIKKNRDGVIFKSINSATNDANEVYYSTEETKLYAYSNFASSMGADGMPIDQLIEEQWLLMIDTNDADWKILRTDKESRNIEFGGFALKADIQIQADGERTLDTVYTIENKEYQCQKYSIFVQFNITPDGYPVNFVVDLKQNIYMVDKIGIVEHYQHPFELELPIIGSQQFPSMRKKLLRYNIK